MARAALVVVAALAKNLPHRSREHEFSAGRVRTGKGQSVLYGTDGFLTSSLGSEIRPPRQTTGAPKRRTGLDGFDGSKGFGFWTGRPVKDRPKTCALLTALRVSRLAPFTPFGGNPSLRKTSQDFGRSGRARRTGLSSRYSETRFTSLIRPDGF